jgi:hypothetical protein
LTARAAAATVADVNNDRWPDVFTCSGTFNPL